MADPEIQSSPRRNQNIYRGLSRSVIVNHYRSDVAGPKERKLLEPAKPLLKLKDFLTEKVFKWFIHSLAHLFGRKHPFRVYQTVGSSNGIYRMHSHEMESMDANITVALVADWATDTAESVQVSNKIKSHNPDYTIHLGDTYYVGDETEVNDNYLNPGCPWHRGTCGSFALMGNHEMYSMGIAYYDKLLPSLGILEPTSGKYDGQKASFFCLQTRHWLIIGLDTGYNSVGFPFVWNSFVFNGKLEPEIIHWLKNSLKLADDKRGIIFLSHHQYCTAFEKETNYEIPGEQLAEIIGGERRAIWIWGHEHRFAVYGRHRSEKGITAFGRCIGNGGMPIELEKMKIDYSMAVSSNLVSYDCRKREIIDRDDAVGWNGYAVMNLNKEMLTIEYYDSNKKLLEESWIADLNTGTIKGSSVKLFETSSDFRIHDSKSIEDMIS